MDTYAKKAIQSDSMRLVMLMQLDRAVLIGARGEFVRSISDHAKRVKFVKCTENADRSGIAKLFAARIEHFLTDGEIADAIRFYKSAPGRKYTERDARMLEAEVLRTKPQVVEFSADELSAIAHFTKSGAGEKLIVKNVTYSDQLFREIGLLAHAILRKCVREAQ